MTRKTFDASVTDFGHALGLFVRRLRASARSQELSWAEAAVMKRLVNEGRATTAELARAEGMRPQSMGAIVAALEEMGMVKRTPHPSDGRQVNIEITARGAAARRSVGEAKRTWLAETIAKLDASEQEKLFAAGEILKRLAEKSDG